MVALADVPVGAELRVGALLCGRVAAGVVKDWGLPVAADEFREEFASWMEGPLPGALELVQAVARKLPVGCLSNSNALHWSVFSRCNLAELFEWRFASHELGRIKPDQDVFTHVAQLVAVAPERILFVDDNTLNVDAACAAGWNAHRTRGVEEARAVMQRYGLVP